ncbi:MAG: type II toxin-antitoxin system VapC family toxin [Actinomycetota bacterium]|nr:type II toxin-antitoxin system VapC family toxin [Actinomycetota bacterium]
MPTRGKPDVLVDTSAAVAFLVTDHPQHVSTFGALADRRLGLSGHAAFETFSVLTRLPSPARRTPAAVHSLLSTNFPFSRFLGADAAGALLGRLSTDGIAGGAIYDALVGAAAVEHDLTLATRDRRAIDVYRTLGVRLEVLR